MANMAIDGGIKQAYVDYAQSVMVTRANNEQTMTSLQIAEITGKRHSDVMRAIRAMEDAWVKVNGRKFALVEYTDAKGEKRPCYELDKVECLYIATKFNDEARAKLVLRWEVLERERQPKVPTTFREALLLAAAQQEQIELQQRVIEDKTQQLDESKEWYSIKRWAQMHRRNWRSYNWRKLKAVSYELGYAVKKIFDANYTEVNIYHRAVFEAVYGK
jgi:phage regulator Rha-like protein